MDWMPGWAWFVVIFSITSFFAYREEEGKTEKKIGATEAVDDGVMSEGALTIRYLIDIESYIRVIAVILSCMLALGVVAFFKYSVG